MNKYDADIYAISKYIVTFIDQHGDTDTIDVYAKSLADVPFALDSTVGDNYLAIVSVELV